MDKEEDGIIKEQQAECRNAKTPEKPTDIQAG
jgi:hypothetical protein